MLDVILVERLRFVVNSEFAFAFSPDV